MKKFHIKIETTCTDPTDERFWDQLGAISAVINEMVEIKKFSEDNARVLNRLPPRLKVAPIKEWEQRAGQGKESIVDFDGDVIGSFQVIEEIV